ncbi:MAG: hotdog fold thioesterase [Balneolales bacterium]
MHVADELKERVELYKRFTADNMATALGIELTSLEKHKIKGVMPVHAPTKQPFGILHGGASVAFAETLASIGGWLALDDIENFNAVGLEINANHVRSVSSGKVSGTATALHAGRTTQVWEILIHDEKQRLVCISRCTLAVVPRQQG